MSPLSNSFLKADQLGGMEPFYPLHAFICEKCYLVQLEEFEKPARIFNDYAYFSSYSESWLRHIQEYTETVSRRFQIGASSLVIEIASNDGYLLQYFKKKGIPVLGIEPAENVAQAAITAGIRTLVKFFGRQTAEELAAEGVTADLLIGNNVLAHVPDVNDFVSGLKTLLGNQGIITMEFPHLLRLIEQNQFDTIYHEHFSYFSLTTVDKIFSSHGLTLFDVEELPTHGGSLRIYARHAESTSPPVADRVSLLERKEEESGLMYLETYSRFSERVREAKRDLLEFLITVKRKGKTVVGYGAPAKGNTLLNYCGIRTDFLDYVVDRSPHKQGHYLPGSHIPIYDVTQIRQTRPDYLLILPWNLRDEIVEQMAHIREWDGKFVIPIPQVEVIA